MRAAHTAAACFVLAVASLYAPRARADDACEPPRDPTARHFGFGTLSGVGYAYGIPTGWLFNGYRQHEINILALEWMLPTMEFEWFTKRGDAVVLSLPINDIVTSLPLNHRALYGNDIYYDFNFGHGGVRAVVGPGGGFAAGFGEGSLRLPVEVGLELLNKNRSFGVKLLARPYAEMIFDNQDVEGGGGSTFVIGFFGYPHKGPPKNDAPTNRDGQPYRRR